ncbi:MAG: ethanolamine ammonia-lyase subunit EutC [Pseudomonadota bacterium]
MSDTDSPKNISALDPWHRLRRHTSARIGLGRVGDGLPTARLLEFQMAHARARDSVHMPFDTASVREILEKTGQSGIEVKSAATNRFEYLQRPDYGRKLATEDADKLKAYAGDFDVAFIVADGLSARAVQENGPILLRAIFDRLGSNWSVAPVVIAHQARVAIGDEIAAHLGAAMSVILIGERPGLSSADSLGAYLTWAPRIGRSNAERNCISNIRPAGLPPVSAADKLVYLMAQARKMKISGVSLKDYSGQELITATEDRALPDTETA